MGLIKEPVNVDFYVDPRPLTKEEREMISAHIRTYKAKIARRNKRKIAVKKKEVNS